MRETLEHSILSGMREGVTIDAAMKRKGKLQSDILALLEQFQADTGLCPLSVTLALSSAVDLSTIGMAKTTRIEPMVTRVDIEVRL